MSRAAEDYVNAYTHPEVKGATRELLWAIAQLIPEGQTATPAISLPDLATKARRNERTARTCRDDLVDLGLIHVHDGGRGKVARYELLQVEGTRPPTAAPLPLRADLRAAAPRRTKEQRSTSDLFSDVEPPTSDLFSDVGPVRAYDIGSFFRRCLTNVGSFFRRWPNRLKALRSTSDLFSDVSITRDADLVSARAIVVVAKYEEEVDARARVRETDTFLDWFAAAYVACYQGARCTIDRAPDGGRVGELLRRGRTVDRLQLMTDAMWRVTTDGVEGSDRWFIAERASVRNIWLLHRKADFLDAEVSRAQAPDLRAAPRAQWRPTGVDAPPPPENVWTQVLPLLELKINRSSFYTWFQGTVLVSDQGDVIEVAKPGAESALSAHWLTKHFHDVVHEAMEQVRPGTRVSFVEDGRAERTGSG